MKQRIRVVAIIKEKDKVLVLKRSQGRSDTPVFWELPTGKIKFGEQPEEAIARTLEEEVGLSTTDIRITDAITFVALEGSSRLDNLYIIYDISVGDEQKPTPAGRYSAYKYVKELSGSGIRLDEASQSVFEISEGKILPHLSPRETANSASVYVDGASRGNPGPAGIGY